VCLLQEFRQREELKNQVDDDGFVTVVNTKRRAVTAAEEVIGRPAKKQKPKEMENFYRFQMREKKRDRTSHSCRGRVLPST
jgi:ribosomal RNA-processing protein 7